MNWVFDGMQLGAVVVSVSLLAKLYGLFMARVYQGEKTILSSILVPLEARLYRLCGVDPEEEMDWRRYACALLWANGVMGVSLFALLILQGGLPLNPEKVPGFSFLAALNTAISFTTNTNWQTYSGEASASYCAQMLGFTVHNFVSAASGMAVAVALVRGLARQKTTSIGNFWVDLTRGVLYLLLPLSFIVSLFFVSQGVIQNFDHARPVALMQPVVIDRGALDGQGQAIIDANGRPKTEQVLIAEATIPMGPVASQEAIKELGTNGGGFFNANSAHPFENPTPLTNFVQCLLILLIPAGLTVTFGQMTGRPKDGWTLFGAMMFLLLAAFGALYWAESAGNPLVAKLGVAGPYLEGKEVRFGVGGSALFATLTTATSCGAVNASHDSLTPLGGLVPMVMMLLGEVAFGGVGSGLYTMIAFVMIAVFVAGLMIGRTPEYLGKKVEAREMWMSVVAVLTAGVVFLLMVGVALLVPAGTTPLANPGAHGLSEILYAFASTANNNGSAFAGLNAGMPLYSLMASLAMLAGRFVPAVAMLALAGSLAGKKYVPVSLGTLPTGGGVFCLWLVVVIVIIGVLAFFPALALGPIAEHLMVWGGV